MRQGEGHAAPGQWCLPVWSREHPLPSSLQVCDPLLLLATDVSSLSHRYNPAHDVAGSAHEVVKGSSEREHEQDGGHNAFAIDSCQRCFVTSVCLLTPKREGWARCKPELTGIMSVTGEVVRYSLHPLAVPWKVKCGIYQLRTRHSEAGKLVSSICFRYSNSSSESPSSSDLLRKTDGTLN